MSRQRFVTPWAVVLLLCWSTMAIAPTSGAAVATTDVRQDPPSSAIEALLLLKADRGDSWDDPTVLSAGEIPAAVFTVLPKDARSAALTGTLELSYIAVTLGHQDREFRSLTARATVYVCTISQYKILNGTKIIMNGWTLCPQAMALITDTQYAFAPSYILASSSNVCHGAAACNDSVQFGLYAGVPGSRYSKYCVYVEAVSGGSAYGCHWFWGI